MKKNHDQNRQQHDRDKPGAAENTALLPNALEGAAKIYFALMMRPLAHWGYVLFSGTTALILAVVV